MSRTLDQIRDAIQAGRVRVSDHALTRMLERHIGIMEAIERAKLLEDYEASRGQQRILVLQSDAGGQSLQAVWELEDERYAVLVTVFEPGT